MDLKFSFGGASPASDDAPSGIPLPFSTAPTSTSSVLELHLSRVADESGSDLISCEAVSGDGVSYARAERSSAGIGLSAAVRSALARVGPELPEALLGSVTAIVASLDGDEAEVFSELGLTVDPAAKPPALVTEALQARTGVAAGTPIRFGEH